MIPGRCGEEPSCPAAPPTEQRRTQTPGDGEPLGPAHQVARCAMVQGSAATGSIRFSIRRVATTSPITPAPPGCRAGPTCSPVVISARLPRPGLLNRRKTKGRSRCAAPGRHGGVRSSTCRVQRASGGAHQTCAEPGHRFHGLQHWPQRTGAAAGRWSSGPLADLAATPDESAVPCQNPEPTLIGEVTLKVHHVQEASAAGGPPPAQG